MQFVRKIEYGIPRWDLFEKRAPWSWLSVKDTSALLNITIQSVHNHVSRGYLPPLEKKPGFRGNKRFFQICKLRAFLEGRDEESICWDWINKHLPDDKFDTIGQARWMVKHLYKLLGIERP
jgi:hypothetical protein